MMDLTPGDNPVSVSDMVTTLLQGDTKDGTPYTFQADPTSTSSPLPPPPPPPLTALPMSVMLLVTPIMLSVIAVSVGGNVLVLLSYKPHLPFADAQSLYLLHLAVSDLLISVVCMPLHLLSTLWSSGWPLGPVMCQVYTAVQLTLLNVTTLVLVLVALDGLVQAEEGVRNTGLEAKKKAYVLLATCWLLAVAVHVPESISWDMLLGRSSLPDNVCKPQFYRSVGQVLFVQIWSFFFPVLILSVINTRLYLRLRRLSKTILTFRYSFPVRYVPRHDVVAQQKASRQMQAQFATSDTSVASSDFHDISMLAFQPDNEFPKNLHTDKLGISKMYIDNSPKKCLSVSDGIISTRSLSTGQIGKLVSYGGKQLDRNQGKGKRSQSSNDVKDAKLPETTDKKITTEGILVTCESDTSSVEGVRGGGGSATEGGCLSYRSHHVSLDRPYRLKRVAVILFTLVLILVVCWLPYSVAFLARALCEHCLHPMVYGVLLWVLYVKSCINPFLYAYNTFAFRNRFRRLLVRIFPIKRFRRMTTDRVSNERTSILN